MADDASDFRIKARLDTSDLPAGADEVVGQMDRISGSLDGAGESAGRAEKSFARMIEEAGTIREAQRISQGFFDVFLGGGRTIEGAAEIMRFFIATAADINPIFASLAVVGASVAVVAGKHAENQEKANDKMKEGATDAPAFATAVERSQERVRAAYEATERLRSFQDELYNQQARAAETTASSLERAADAQKKLNDEILRGAELQALANNKDGPAGDLAIQARFDALRGRSDVASDLAKIDFERNENIFQQEDTSHHIDAKQDEINADAKRLDDLHDNLERAQRSARAYGYFVDQNLSPDDQKKAWEAIQVQTGEAETKARNRFDDLSKQKEDYQSVNSLADDNSSADVIADWRKAKEEFYEASRRERAVANVTRAQAAFGDDKTGSIALQDKIDKNTLALGDLQNKLQDLKDSLANLGVERDTRVARAQNDETAASLKESRDLVAQQNDDFRAKNEQAIRVQEQIAGDEGRSLADRQEAMRRANDLHNAALQREIDEGTSSGDFRHYQPEKPLSQDEVSALKGQITDNNASLQQKIRDEGDKEVGISEAGKPQYDAASQTLKDLVTQGMTRVSGSNNAELKNILATAPDDRSRGQLLANEYGDSSDPKARAMAQQIAAALRAQDSAKNLNLKGGEAGAYDAAVSRQADLINKMGGIAMADGFQKLVDATKSQGDLQTRVTAILMAANATHDERLQLLAQQLLAAQQQLATLSQQVNALKSRTSFGNSR